ncbi:MAG: DUF1275 domain-containing protein [Chloroflexi bacterium]|nr:DUF1275 domain-containing protein [Chloroflexota bacterium]
MQATQRVPARIWTWAEGAAVLLGWVGGFVDAVCYVSLRHIFVANMTGNTVIMATDLAQGDLTSAMRRAFPIPLFLIGVVAGVLSIETADTHGLRSPQAFALGVEALLLGLFAALGSILLPSRGLAPASPTILTLLTALPSLAMGIQSAALRRVDDQPIRTTYVTGVLTALAETAVVGLIRRKRTLVRAGGPGTPRSRRVRLLAGIWVAYAIGALCGGVGQTLWQVRALLAPIAALCLLAAFNLPRPSASHPSAGRLTR